VDIDLRVFLSVMGTGELSGIAVFNAVSHCAKTSCGILEQDLSVGWTSAYGSGAASGSPVGSSWCCG